MKKIISKTAEFISTSVNADEEISTTYLTNIKSTNLEKSASFNKAYYTLLFEKLHNKKHLKWTKFLE
jgi:hypothetical protein